MTCGVSDLTMRFGSRAALSEITFEFPPGDVTGIVGGDGAGKTTLLRCLAGAQPATSGRVNRPDAARLGYLAASSGTYPDLSVAENLEFVAKAYRVPPADARTRAAELLERTGLASFRDRLAGNLSGGMRQKLGVIRALIHRPELVVLDEPTTGVDPVSRADLWWLLAHAAAEGAAVVFSSTYLDEAERASSVLVLEAGRALASGTPTSIVDAMPGSIVACASRPAGEAATHAWRRRGAWRQWTPDAARPDAIVPDLTDSVTVLSLAR